MFVVIVESADHKLGVIAGVYDNPEILKDLESTDARTARPPAA